MARVVVTGGAGFIGSSLVRQLLDAGRDVLVVVEPGGSTQALEDLNVERVTADICDSAAMTKICSGAETLFHLAAIYRVWFANGPSSIYRVNLEGTAATLLAAQKAGVKRIVYTASIAAVGENPDGSPADETVAFNHYDIANEYILTKHLSERLALRFAEAGMPIVVVNPAFPFGERDIGPTPTGGILLTIAKGEAPALPNGGFNCVDVDVVARGHMLAEEKGRIGERYILGDHNVSYLQFAQVVGQVVGRRVPRRVVPAAPAMAAAWCYEQTANYVTRKAPPVTVKTALYASRNRFFDVSKARRELGLPSVPLEESIQRSVAWFRNNGHL